MSTLTRDAALAYRRNSILTASKEKLILLLYEGALRGIDEAIRGFTEKNSARAHEAASRSYAIVSELRAVLDFQKGGQIAGDLNRLYLFVQDRLLNANISRSVPPLKEARNVLATLKEGWDGILRPS